MTVLQQLTPGQANQELRLNEIVESLSAVGLFSTRHPATTALTWAYYGGRYQGNTVVDGTLSLTNNILSYVVVHRTTGVVSASTVITNYNDITTYARLFQITTSGGVITVISDFRMETGGLFNQASLPIANTEYRGLTFTSDTGSTADSDPGNGLFKWNNATQASATVLYFDDLTVDAVSAVTYFTSIGSNGYVQMQQADDSSKWQVWKITALVAGVGYSKFTVALQAKLGDIATGKLVYCIFATAGVGGLINWVDAKSDTGINATVPVVSFTATNAAADVDAVIARKGSGGFALQVANGLVSGGDKRGTNAVDLSLSRSVSSQVASGVGSFLAGVGTASGSSSVCIGGGFATSSGAIAIGQNSATTNSNATAVGGASNIASGNSGGVFAGTNGVASGQQSGILSGATNTASATGSTAVGGDTNVSDGLNSMVTGMNGAARTIVNARVQGGKQFAASGDSQFMRAILSASTSNATQTTVSTDRNTAAATNQLTLPNNSAYVFKGYMVVRQNTTGDTKAWLIEGLIKRGASAASTAMVAAATVTQVAADAGAAAWALAVDADTTLGCLRVRVTGEAAKTLRWVITIDSTQVAG